MTLTRLFRSEVLICVSDLFMCVCVCAFGVSSALSGLILGQAYKSLGQVSVGYQKKVVIICY